jgi:DNA-binding NarL/FixJ family response regulator
MKFSKRQEEIFNMICQGMTNVVIAQHMGVSLATVKTQLQRMFTKTGTHNKAALVSYVKS